MRALETVDESPLDFPFPRESEASSCEGIANHQRQIGIVRDQKH
jgi:hypothetical protein